MYCNQCGKQIPADSRFCNYCGAPVGGGDAGRSTDERIFRGQAERQGMLVYLRDVLSMQLSVNRLARVLRQKQNAILIHDEWYFWKRYPFRHPILSEKGNEFSHPYTGLYLSYSHRLNRYYFMFDEGQKPVFSDHNGNVVTHRYGNPCSRGFRPTAVLDSKTREQLCTSPVFELTRKKGRWYGNYYGKYELVNGDATYWGGHGRVRDNFDNLKVFDQVKPIIEHFERSVAEWEDHYRAALPGLKAEIEAVSKELADAKKILTDLYDVNVIPSKYRSIGCSYFIYDFYSTSNVPLDNVFLHIDLDKIQSQLDSVLKNQGEMLLQQAVLIAQNEALISQNQRLFGELADLNQSVKPALRGIQAYGGQTAEWARIAAMNTETCAWISTANYIRTL